MLVLMLLMLDGARRERQRGADLHRDGLPAGHPRSCGRHHVLLWLAVDRPSLRPFPAVVTAKV